MVNQKYLLNRPDIVKSLAPGQIIAYKDFHRHNPELNLGYVIGHVYAINKITTHFGRASIELKQGQTLVEKLVPDSDYFFNGISDSKDWELADGIYVCVGKIIPQRFSELLKWLNRDVNEYPRRSEFLEKGYILLNAKENSNLKNQLNVHRRLINQHYSEDKRISAIARQ